MARAPSLGLKIFFWVILGVLSTSFAEVLTGSFSLVMFNPIGWLFVFPVYFLHTIVLSYIVFNFGRPTFYTLFIAGALFGMYEAYLTKVVWHGFSSEPALMLGGIAVLETLVLIFFAHAFFAFILPVILSENFLTRSRESLDGLTPKLQQWISHKGFLLGILIFLAFYHGVTSASPLLSGVSSIAMFGSFFLLLHFWNRTSGKEFDMKSLLPNRRQFKIFVVFLILLYLWHGRFMHPEKLPAISAQVTVWIIYAVLTTVFVFHLRKSRTKMSAIHVPELSWSKLFKLGLFFTFLSLLASVFVGPFKGFVGLFVLFGGIILGLFIFGASCISITRN